MRVPLAFGLLLVSPILSGCLVKAAADVVTAPIRVGSKAVDLATTSQSEADEKRGREIRKREERLGKLEREYRKLSETATMATKTPARKRERSTPRCRKSFPRYRQNLMADRRR